ncbi:DnaJ-like protein subfamily A member 2 [Microtus ochrogaster]|uniref:DnaJ-like protein subfamily A member 2 n=1 Tax=Microtus ochrogaster TaxID=79684 RepID=A0A8J6GYA1_MICOH|nr:DnaJ-like protein subfamily A member 2 [Microtus ochrogaster]
MDDIFSHIFGGGLFGFMGNQSRSRNGRRRGEDMMHPLKYFEDTLKDVHGRRASVHHEHQSALASMSEGLLFAHLAAGKGHQQADPVHHSAFGHSCSKLLYDLVFQRDGNDLHMTYKIGLVEALCGFQFTFKHLDARQIVVKYPPGKVIEPGCVRVVRGEGMPQYRNPFEKGDLYIKFDVQFPENNWINPDKLSELEDLLPSRPEVPNVIGETEEVELQEFDSTRGSGGGQRREAYNDSSDEESSSHHGPGVQCAHQ